MDGGKGMHGKGKVTGEQHVPCLCLICRARLGSGRRRAVQSMSGAVTLLQVHQLCGLASPLPLLAPDLGHECFCKTASKTHPW